MSFGAKVLWRFIGSEKEEGKLRVPIYAFQMLYFYCSSILQLRKALWEGWFRT